MRRGSKGWFCHIGLRRTGRQEQGFHGETETRGKAKAKAVCEEMESAKKRGKVKRTSKHQSQGKFNLAESSLQGEKKAEAEAEAMEEMPMTNPESPDFLHKSAKKCLRMDDDSNPTWVKNMLKKAVFTKGDNTKSHSQSLEEVISLLESGITPESQISATNLAGILERCKKEQNKLCAMRMHTFLKRKGLEDHKQLGNYLVSLLVEVDCVHDAQNVFDKLVYRSECSWNSLIKGYDRCGDSQHALSLYQKMQDDSVRPSGYTFVPLLKACIKLKDVRRAEELHADLSRKGLDTNLFVGSTLVDMYACFGLVEKAQRAFDKLSRRNIVSWTALISGYARHGDGKEALNCFEQMQREGILPDAATYACILKACSVLRDVDKGQELHHAIFKQKLDKNPVIGNALVDMYAKCGMLSKAQEIFEKLSIKDVVSWTSLISGYVQQGDGEEALDCFEQMQRKGVPPDAATYVCALKACGVLGAIGQGIDMHVEIARKGLIANKLVGNTLVDMYASCGLLQKALDVFKRLSTQDVVAWTALIGGYANHGQGKEALNCFEQMQCKGILPEPSTFVCTLKACSSIGAMDKGREIHAEIKRKCLEENLLVGNALVDMYVKCGSLSRAQKVFDKLSARDVISWTSIILGYSQLGKTEWVLHFFERMKADGIIPNLVTFLSVLHACNHAGLVEKGLLYFDSMSRDYGINPALEHYSCMVDLLGRAGQVKKAVALILKMPFSPTLVMWDSVLAACRKWHNLELGKAAFEHALRLNDKSSAAYVSMANIFADAGMENEAKEVEALRLKNEAWKGYE